MYEYLYEPKNRIKNIVVQLTLVLILYYEYYLLLMLLLKMTTLVLACHLYADS